MNILIFGATGMVGRGALRECLADPGVDTVVTLGRTPVADRHPKLREIIHSDLMNYSAVEGEMSGFDACLFCLGVSSAGMTEARYSHLTFDITLAAARTLARLNPQMTFIYVSGAGTDGTERGRSMWARVKGRTENALLALPFKGAYMLRPGIIQPLHGIKSKTRSYRLLYSALSLLLPVLRALFPKSMTSTEELGRVMLSLAKCGDDRHVLEAADIARIGSAPAR